MGRFTKYKALLITTTLPVLFFVMPFVALAADDGPGMLESAAQEVVFALVVAVTGMFLWFGGLILDAGIETFLVGFSSTYLHTGVGVAIDSTWVIIRDTMNLFFIFGLVYIGLRMILDSDNSNIRRWLINLIIAALLINFSLFITKFVVDFSNLISYEIALEGLDGTEDADGKLKVNMSSTMKDRMGITGILGGIPDGAQGAAWSFIFGTGILFTITAFVFAAGGVLLIIRFAVLCLFLVMSPLMFLSWIIPGMKDTMNKYWSGFIGRAFFAPVYLFMLYLSIQVIGGLQKAIGNGGIANPKWPATLQAKTAGGLGAASPTEAALGTLPFFVLICIFMIASLVIAQKIGADGGSKAVSMGKNLSNKAQGVAKRTAGGATFGLAAKGAQGTIGLGARKLADNQKLQAWAAKSKTGERALRAARATADSSFDARKVGGMGKAMGIGEGAKGGYDTRVKNRQERDEEFMKSLKVDIPIEETEARKKAEEEKIRQEAGAQRQGGQDELDTIKSMAENDGKTTVALTTEIGDLGKDIDKLSGALSAKVEAGTITTKERADEEAKIAALAETRRMKELAKKEKQEQNTILGQITQNGIRASEATDPAEAARFREEKQRLQSELEGRVDYEARKRAGKTAIIQSEDRLKRDALDKEVNSEVAKVENEKRYRNQTDYLKRREREAASGFTINADGTHTYHGSSSPLAAESVKHLKKTIGRGINEMADKDKQNKANSDLAKNLKALQEAEAKGEKPKEESGGDSH